VFTPLALNFRHRGRIGIFIAIFTTFIISGFWHGAGLHFIVWGAYYGLLYIPYVFSKKGIKSMVSKKTDPLQVSDLPKIILTFSLVCLGYVFFRSTGLTHSIKFIKHIILNIFEDPVQFTKFPGGKMAFVYIIPLIIGDWYLRRNERELKNTNSAIFRELIYAILLVFVINSLLYHNNEKFIYFDF
jgi:hypothetical protein